MNAFKFFNEKPVISSFLFAIIIIIIVNILIGTYFEEYEIFFQQFFLKTCSFPPGMKLSVSHLGLIPVYQKLSELFPNSSIYALANTSYITLILFGLIYSYVFLSKSIEDKLKFYFVLSTFVLIVLHNIIYISNVRIGILSTTLVYFWLYLVVSKKVSNKHILLIIIFFLLGNLIRTEMFIIVSFLILCYFITWGHKKLIIPSSIILLVSVIIFLSLSYKMKSSKPELYYLHRAEHIIFDREGLSPNIESKYDEQLNVGIRMFFLDDGVISIDDYKEITNKFSFIAYMKNFKKFFRIYFNKLVEVFYDMVNYSWLIFINLVLLYLLFLSSIINTNKKKVTVLFLLTLFLIIPLVLNIFVFVPKRFTAGYLTFLGLFLVSILCLNIDKYVLSKKFIKIVAFITFILIIQFAFNENISINDNKLKARYFKDVISEINNQNKIPIVVLPDFENIYSSRLFASKHEESFRHYYLNMFFFGYYNFYCEYMKELMGSEFRSLKNRIHYCTNDNVVFLSNEFHNQMLKNYSEHIHQTKIEFEKLDEYSKSTFNTYKVKLLK